MTTQPQSHDSDRGYLEQWRRVGPQLEVMGARKLADKAPRPTMGMSSNDGNAVQRWVCRPTMGMSSNDGNVVQRWECRPTMGMSSNDGNVVDSLLQLGFIHRDPNRRPTSLIQWQARLKAAYAKQSDLS